ncbi:MAG: transcription/translation regulatory transformer protein RfaH [Aeromonadaceae bacterium]|nr:transcription/translation regulatory transformer protein RfaH [Aeromonadaceae bacterium]
MRTWYLAYCKCKEEERARLHLRNQGVDSYYPQVQVEKLVRGQVRQVSEPMFPCYLFVHVDLEEFPASRLKSTRGLRRIITYGEQWQTVPQPLIIDLMRHEDSDEARERLNQLPKQGERVTIEEGPFSGLQAIYQEPDGERRSVLLLQLLNQEVCKSFCNLSFRRLA